MDREVILFGWSERLIQIIAMVQCNKDVGISKYSLLSTHHNNAIFPCASGLEE